jgi:fermentation-respiration switch protein FrsA (DUF1100 family)
LILHGELDEVVPIDDAHLLQRSSAGRARLEVVAGADHQFSAAGHQAQVVARAVGFLSAQLEEPAP